MKKIICCFLLISSCICFSQNVTGDLENYIDNFIKNVPGGSGSQYKEPILSQTNIWKNTINKILEQDIENARIASKKIGYKIVKFTDNTTSKNQIFYILEKEAASKNHWGTYIFTKNAEIKNLIITAPHIINDINTGQQAVYCLKKTLAKAVFLNGTERCNNSTFSNCSGTTTTCNNGAEKYRVSDVAHAENSLFHQTTAILFNKTSNSIFIQLHGFSKESEDPFLILSNGTRETPTTDYIEMLKNELLKEDNTLTFKIPHKDLSWEKLLAFTNTQGRFINGSKEPCETASTNTSGRFIHIEQEFTRLRDDKNDWKKMSNALQNVFSKTLNIDDNNFDEKVSIYPNPTKKIINIDVKTNSVKISEISVVDVQGRIVIKKINNLESIDISKISKGIYSLKVKFNDNLNFTKKIVKE